MIHLDVHIAFMMNLPMTPAILEDIGRYELSALNIKNNSLCISTFTAFDMSRFSFLQTISIGDNCCSNVNKFTLSHLMFLKSLEIGKNSFTNSKSSYGTNLRKSFTIDSCVRLVSISIKQYSFSDFGGTFSIHDCCKLETLEIGDISSESYCFYSCSLVLSSM